MTTHQTILITGATSGIGRNAALTLMRRGYRVVASGRSTEALAKLKREAEDGLQTLRLDVTDPASITEAQHRVEALTSGRGIDVLINNAGYGGPGPAEQCTDADLRAQYDVNVFGLMAVTRAFVPRMRQRGQGRVINIGSVAGRFTFPMMGVYSSTKYAVESLTDALRMELRPFGIRVVVIEPGPITTGFNDRSMQEVAKYRTDDSPYAAVLARSEKIRELSDRAAAEPARVVRVIERAISAQRPRARYVVPLGAQLMLWMHRLLPTFATDWMLRNVAGLTRKRIAMPAPSDEQTRPGTR